MYWKSVDGRFLLRSESVYTIMMTLFFIQSVTYVDTDSGNNSTFTMIFLGRDESLSDNEISMNRPEMRRHDCRRASWWISVVLRLFLGMILRSTERCIIITIMEKWSDTGRTPIYYDNVSLVAKIIQVLYWDNEYCACITINASQLWMLRLVIYNIGWFDVEMDEDDDF